MSSPSSLEEEASSSPEVQEHPSSTPMSPAAATPEVLKMSDEHPSSHPMLHVVATPEVYIPLKANQFIEAPI